MRCDCLLVLAEVLEQVGNVHHGNGHRQVVLAEAHLEDLPALLKVRERCLVVAKLLVQHAHAPKGYGDIARVMSLQLLADVARALVCPESLVELALLLHDVGDEVHRRRHLEAFIAELLPLDLQRPLERDVGLVVLAVVEKDLAHTIQALGCVQLVACRLRNGHCPLHERLRVFQARQHRAEKLPNRSRQRRLLALLDILVEIV
mmetsp:Transcript_8224/g.21231  ORF Transcript_8224/g.21231 Transcript_8224/m.21231 type:complete len:204 (+) Transcript_8224:1776-2387(+)